VWIVEEKALRRVLGDEIKALQASGSLPDTDLKTLLVHFSRTLAYPANREQLGLTMFLYMAIAYVVGALIHSCNPITGNSNDNA
jgi:predicted membrane protein